MADPATEVSAKLAEVSAKLNVVIALLLNSAVKDQPFNDGKHTTGDLASFLKRHGLEYAEIAAILDSPIKSVRELVGRQNRSSKKKK